MWKATNKTPIAREVSESGVTVEAWPHKLWHLHRNREGSASLRSGTSLPARQAATQTPARSLIRSTRCQSSCQSRGADTTLPFPLPAEWSLAPWSGCLSLRVQGSLSGQQGSNHLPLQKERERSARKASHRGTRQQPSTTSSWDSHAPRDVGLSLSGVPLLKVWHKSCTTAFEQSETCLITGAGCLRIRPCPVGLSPQKN